MVGTGFKTPHPQLDHGIDARLEPVLGNVRGCFHLYGFFGRHDGSRGFRGGLEGCIVGLNAALGEEFFQVHFLIEQGGNIRTVDLVDERDLFADYAPGRRTLDLLDQGPLGVGLGSELLVQVKHRTEQSRGLVEIELHLIGYAHVVMKPGAARHHIIRRFKFFFRLADPVFASLHAQEAYHADLGFNALLFKILGFFHVIKSGLKIAFFAEGQPFADIAERRFGGQGNGPVKRPHGLVYLVVVKILQPVRVVIFRRIHD